MSQVQVHAPTEEQQEELPEPEALEADLEEVDELLEQIDAELEKDDGLVSLADLMLDGAQGLRQVRSNFRCEEGACLTGFMVEGVMKS